MNNPTYKELLVQREALEKHIESVRKAEIADALHKIKSLIDALNLTRQDILPLIRKKREIRVSYPKYRNPLTGQTWNGRGKPPNWTRDSERSKFEILSSK